MGTTAQDDFTAPHFGSSALLVIDVQADFLDGGAWTVAVVQPDDVHDRPTRRSVGRDEFGHPGEPPGRAGDGPRTTVEEVGLHVDASSAEEPK